MLTHYIVTFRGKVCSLIGIGSIHRKGVLAPALPEEQFFVVEIPRGRHRKPNHWARAVCMNAIERTNSTRRRMLRFARKAAHVLPSSTMERFSSTVSSNTHMFRIVGMQYHPTNERPNPASVARALALSDPHTGCARSEFFV